jgi:hypothetical protein
MEVGIWWRKEKSYTAGKRNPVLYPFMYFNHVASRKSIKTMELNLLVPL